MPRLFIFAQRFTTRQQVESTAYCINFMLILQGSVK